MAVDYKKKSRVHFSHTPIWLYIYNLPIVIVTAVSRVIV